MQRVMPQNRTDAYTMLHDIDYLRFCGIDKLINQADARAIQGADTSPAGVATKIGLSIRNYFGLDFSQPLPGLTTQETRLAGHNLFNLVASDPLYRARFKQLGVRIV